MKNLYILSLIAGALLTTPAHATQSCTGEILIQVNGLVCDFCARALEKVFGEEEAVSDIAVDLDNSLVTVRTHADKHLSSETITQRITDAGYNVVAIDSGCQDE